MQPGTVDVVNDDGSVTRTVTFIRTTTYTADQYAAMQTQIQNQIDALTATLTAVQANVSRSQTNLSKVNIKP